MSCIRVLPANLVMKIAAGEVLERPGSAVKELLENAVDAGATHIGLTVEAGGISLIRVTDDGCGMSAEDLALSVTPHATSKIHGEDDLYRIGSLGFRGEALPSIAAVSRLRILSRPHESDEGHEIEIVAEDVRSSRAAGCPAGTTVEVRDLFFSVPARRKFLKQASTEFGHVNTQFARIALAHPKIAFDLSNNGKKVQQLPVAACRAERIAKLYSPELADALIEFSGDEAGLTIEGYAAPPADARSSANWQFTFVNGRFIRDKFVQHAVKEAYRGLIDPRRFPVIFLFLSIDPAAVDVNAHPTKIEVRWHDSNTVHAQVLGALRKALQAADLTPTLSTSSAPAAPAPEWQARLRSDFAREFKNTPPVQPSIAFGADRGMDGSTGRSDTLASPTSHRDVGDDVWRTMHGQAGDRAEAPRDSPGAPTGGEAVSRSAIQLHNTYLVCETSDGMVIIDQHALHERILYEELKQRITSGPLESQRLLLPETVSVTPAQSALLEANTTLLKQLGLEVTPFGPDSVAIQSFPAIMKDTDAAGFLRDLLDKLEQRGNQPHTEVVVHEVLDMMACKAAVKAGDPLTPEEIRALVDRKELVEKSSNCPHGRPTTLRFTVQDLERQFKRT